MRCCSGGGHQILWQELFATGEVVWEVEKLGVITKLLEDADGFEWLGSNTTEQLLDLRRCDEVPVKSELEG